MNSNQSKKRAKVEEEFDCESGQNRKRKAKKRTWEDSFEALVKYKEKYGDCNVPAKFPEDRALGQWVEKVRRGACAQPTSPQQRDRLTNLGFNWETLEQRINREWNERYERLKVYKSIFGDCSVPSKGSKKDELKAQWAAELGNWATRQRLLYNQGRLDPLKKQKLDAIDFSSSLTKRKKEPNTPLLDQEWFNQYQNLVDFNTKHGHCLVTLTSFEDKSLFMWVKGQRENFSRGLIRKERKKLLDDLGFVWKIDNTDAQKSHNQRQWEKMFDLLKDFKEEHGHFPTGNRLPLGNWLDHQKTYWRRGELHKSRLERLLSIGVTLKKAR